MTKYKNELTGKRILFGTVPGDGHFNPLTGLAKYLQELGCDVRWYASDVFKCKLEKLSIPHYGFKKAWDVNGVNVNEILPERQKLTDPAEKLSFDLIHIFGNRAPEYYEDILEIHESFPFDVFIADSCFSAIPLVSKLMSIPVVAVGVIPLAEESVDLAPYGTGLPPAATEEQRAMYFGMKDALANVVFKTAIDSFSAILDRYQVPHEKAILFDTLIRQSDLFLQIGAKAFEYDRSDLGENVRFVGALLPYSESKSRQPWFDQKLLQYGRIVLVTQGTVEHDINKILVPTLEAFKNSETLVIATTGGNGTAELRARFPFENLIIEDFIPFDDVMPRADVYVTNGGYGGTLLSIHNQLPMVAAGVHEGKNEVCSRIGHFGCGINLETETPTPDQIRESVHKILSNDIFKKNVFRISTHLDVDANEKSAGHILDLLEERVVCG
ncbi:glycosyltransferase [Dyadobacter fermentans]|uniref:Putative glycosyltransferase n=1 Tax=Dyadobacter fermentans (strain ATCC 700827 / DSM 18053 / CIP 107007 / KCTC 52180 / NS114) TaxID=471854 RepID=C6VW33_DYAFD|nr:nucleotide disphospho-sugar-binding domain-containing protein [Dyadobacter fermentans]ACT93165.1 putative glycosyltransferase [Dyadobacter fermentans DSM 18053]